MVGDGKTKNFIMLLNNVRVDSLRRIGTVYFVALSLHPFQDLGDGFLHSLELISIIVPF